jgi:long-chain acyl-CoA synthetase
MYRVGKRFGDPAVNLAHLLQRKALEHPDRPAIFSGSQPVATHAQWARHASRLGARLRASGLQPGDRVVLFMRNHPRTLELMFGAWWAGLVVVPVNAKLHLKEVQWIVENAGARWAFVTSDIVPDPGGLPGLDGVMDVDSAACNAWVREGEGLPEMEDRAPDDTAWLFYTSGTTGRPKGVMITHRNLLTMGLGYFNDVDHVDPQDAIVYAAPMSHGAGLYAIPHLMAGARHVVPASGGFDAPSCSNLAARSALSRCSPPRPSSNASSTKPRPRASRPISAATASRPSSMAAPPCTPPTSAARCAPWARASCRSTARAKAP